MAASTLLGKSVSQTIKGILLARQCGCGEKATRSLLTNAVHKYWDIDAKKFWNPVVVRSFCDKCWEKVNTHV